MLIFKIFSPIFSIVQTLTSNTQELSNSDKLHNVGDFGEEKEVTSSPKSQDEEVRASKKIRTEENVTVKIAEISRQYESKIKDEPNEVEDRRLIGAASRKSSLNILPIEFKTEKNVLYVHTVWKRVHD